ncbi:MAG: hypothetical protein ACKPIX_16355, partial [Dolichospermum sp.]
MAVAGTAAVVEPTPLVAPAAAPVTPARSVSPPPTMSPTSPAFPEPETSGEQDADDDWLRRQRRRIAAPEAMRPENLLIVLESMTEAIAHAKEKAAAATSSTLSTSDFAIVLDTFQQCMDQMNAVLTSGVIADQNRHQRLREEKAAMELHCDMLAALSELKHYKGSKGAFINVDIRNVFDRRIQWGETTKGKWLRMIMPLSEARAFLKNSVLGPGRLEAKPSSVNLHAWWKLSVVEGSARFVPATKLTQRHGVVQQVNVNGFELSPDALAGVHMHQFRVFCRGAEQRKQHDRAAISRSVATSSSAATSSVAISSSAVTNSAQPAGSDDDAKGFTEIVERALLAHARSQLIQPTKFTVPWAIAFLSDMPVILWTQFVRSDEDAGTQGSAGSHGQWCQPSPHWHSHWHWQEQHWQR